MGHSSNDLPPTAGPNLIQTDRLFLREARMSDLDDFHAMFSNDEVMRFWSCPPHTTISQTECFLVDMIESPNNGTSNFVIVLPNPSDPPSTIGKVGIWSLANREIGFMLNRSCWGKGYMAEALAAVIDHVWSGKGGDMNKIVADVDPRNVASVGILKKLGFEVTGYGEKTYETHLGWCDSVYLTLQKPSAK